ncbi:MAG: hypothetical protein K2Q22_09710 [Cytophagales bacterium]|nr:hypothetical protein [Cytophagales bacterium]
MKSYIVTDLTRFKNKDIVCTALVDLNTGACYRPLPYLDYEQVIKLNIIPGSIIQGKLVLKSKNIQPHVEDSTYENLKYLGECPKGDFIKALEFGLADSIETGFNVSLNQNQKHIEIADAPNKSIITIEVTPYNIEIRPDSYEQGKIKICFTDNSGKYYSYLSITDLGFYNYALRHHSSGDLDEINSFLSKQDKIYLRVGLSREFKSLDLRNGYWLQINGIYTFPEYLSKIRQY